MLLKYFYDQGLAHASYLVGCQKTGEAIVIDPGRHVEPYLTLAAAEGMKIVGAVETHIHADFVSGSLELADRAGARLYLSDEGPADWKYAFAQQRGAQLLKHGDTFRIGKIEFTVAHTPGHTPESISLLLTDRGGGADRPMGVFTGDFMFVGSVGRPDLLETAAGVVGSAEEGAYRLFESLKWFRELPDYLQVWPAHGAGSACGKGLGAVPSTTVGYERLFNPAFQYNAERAFVDYILADQPETPPYFAEMKRVNKVGPKLIRELPAAAALPPAELGSISREHLVIDTAASEEYAAAHVPGTINLPLESLVQWAGFFVDYRRPVFLLTEGPQLEQALRALRSIGIDDVGGYFEAQAVREAGLRSQAYRSKTVKELRGSIERGAVQVLDVRADTEFRAGHIPGAKHRYLGNLMKRPAAVELDRPVVVHCLGGARSAIAASVLQRDGYEVTNMTGGYRAWADQGFPTAV